MIDYGEQIWSVDSTPIYLLQYFMTHCECPSLQEIKHQDALCGQPSLESFRQCTDHISLRTTLYLCVHTIQLEIDDHVDKQIFSTPD